MDVNSHGVEGGGIRFPGTENIVSYKLFCMCVSTVN